MKKRIFSILISLCMMLAFFPIAVSAEEPVANIDITITGFELGKTPADCKITSITSMIPGVDYSLEDVTESCWRVIDGESERNMKADEVFTVDTTYKFLFYIPWKDKQTETTITINGKPASYVFFNDLIGIDIRHSFEQLKLPTITINGPDEICSKQDYEFTVTVPEGVTIVNSSYGNMYIGSSLPLTPNEDGTLSGVVNKSSYATMFTDNKFDVTISGTMEGISTGISANKSVTIQNKHIFVDGVCGCGEVQKYTVQYDGGANYGLAVDFKIHNKDLTLRGETFTREGYVQRCWEDENGTEYDFGEIYSTNAEITLYPVWDQIVTMRVPFTIQVKKGGDADPGKATFELQIIGANASEEEYADVTISATVTTDGVDSYDGFMTLTGPSEQLWDMLCEGAFVQQVNGGEDGWTYDDTVWGLLIESAALAEDFEPECGVLILPTIYEETDDGRYYDLDWTAQRVRRMSFTNTYTKFANSPDTGDTSNMTLWFVLLVVSAAGAVGTVVYSKRRRLNRAK
ncbi:MAG: InlB B-repeat-containing protein [Erysipelotrichaceae bacterium]|nr:InlB B-repeat-containing protein [Erysipelotrichaceae bacterium]